MPSAAPNRILDHTLVRREPCDQGGRYWGAEVGIRIPVEPLEKAMLLLSRAKRMVLLGSPGLALEPWRRGGVCTSDCREYSHIESHLSRLSECDLCVVLAYPGYLQESIYAAERAIDHRLPVLAIAAQSVQSLIELADVFLPVQIAGTTNRTVWAVSLAVEVLAVELETRSPKGMVSRMQWSAE